MYHSLYKISDRALFPRYITFITSRCIAATSTINNNNHYFAGPRIAPEFFPQSSRRRLSRTKSSRRKSCCAPRGVNRTFDNGRWREKEGVSERSEENEEAIWQPRAAVPELNFKRPRDRGAVRRDGTARHGMTALSLLYRGHEAYNGESTAMLRSLPGILRLLLACLPACLLACLPVCLPARAYSTQSLFFASLRSTPLHGALSDERKSKNVALSRILRGDRTATRNQNDS